MQTINPTASGAAQHDARPASFNLLRWFSLASLLIIGAVALGLGYVSTGFVVNQSVERDALLTAQFIQSIGEAELRHAHIPAALTIGDVLDNQPHPELSGFDPLRQNAARDEFLDHLAQLPDLLLASVYGLDHKVLWSTNPALMGVSIEDDDELDEAFEMKVPVAASYHRIAEERPEQKLLREPEYLFIENYIPLFNADRSKVVAMVEIYKEPADLVARIRRGYLMIWLATLAGGALIYGGLYWIVRRAANLLRTQERQLVANETFVALGEMSSAVAHSLRNPLATIRSSAELAQEVASEDSQKNIADIIGQVDRMSRWVRELLVSLKPMSTDREAVDLTAAIELACKQHEGLIRRCHVQLNWSPRGYPKVVSHQVQLMQILNSLFTNAVEAMPDGGILTIEVQEQPGGRLTMMLSDTGKGMTRQQERMVFKPFFTTKQGGLGVGLSLVKRIMERFEGSVDLTSQEQEGTRVCLNFRVAAGGDYGAQHTAGRG